MGPAPPRAPSSRATRRASRPSASLLRHVVRRGVPMLSLYAFSRENWARSDEEVAGLFDLLEQAIRSETAELAEQGVRVRLLGRLDELPAGDAAVDRTGARGDGRRNTPAAQHRLQLRGPDGARGRVPATRRERHRGRPDRRGGDLRRALHGRHAGPRPRDPHRRRAAALSNFLIWQSAYAEFYTSPLLWPDFGPAAFDHALKEFARRTRRFGR